MNNLEFIAWDKENKKFTIDFILNSTGTPYQSHYDKNPTIKNNYDIFQYTGKIDIHGNKIYYDSSIVKFKCNFMLSNIFYEYIGFFYFDIEELKIYIKTNKLNLVIPYEKDIIVNLEIIGTLQENTELLEIK